MSKRKVLKKFRIQKRFEVWMEQTVKAETIEDALVIAKKAGFSDFVDIPDDVDLNDVTHLDGTSVAEYW